MLRLLLRNSLSWLGILCFSFLAAGSAHAVDYTWAGTTGVWSEAANWQPAGVPGAYRVFANLLSLG
ncbi:MAG: hypothetical protein KY468_14655, partial [Armatimonadetes bacterium]|nr:hypothetical protein [Armatimonadota bacterium]